MAIHPDSNFPLLERDQSDVIRMFLELMREGDCAGRAPEVTTNQQVGPRDDSGGSWLPGEPPDNE
jgi:hypothetical protein